MTKRKKLLIVSHNLQTGGIQKALLNLLHEIKGRYDITLFLFSKAGTYTQQIPPSIHIIEANPLIQLLAISQQQTKQYGLKLYLLRALLVIWSKKIGHARPIQFLLKTQKKLEPYDVAISYVQSPQDYAFYGGCNEFVLDHVEAQKKMAYLHCDFLHYGGNTEKNRQLYKRFDRVIAVSEGCRTNFVKAIPALAEKTKSIPNCHQYDMIKQQAAAFPIVYEAHRLHLLTVARLSEEKGILRMIPVIDQLVQQGYKLRWHIIGEGPERAAIEQCIAKYALQRIVILHGHQPNPYRYMTNADLLIIPSLHEAAPLVIDEAKCVGIPILTTATTSAVEMVEACEAGWVCDNSSEGLLKQLQYICQHTHELPLIRAHLKNHTFTNTTSVQAFHTLLAEDITNDSST